MLVVGVVTARIWYGEVLVGAASVGEADFSTEVLGVATSKDVDVTDSIGEATDAVLETIFSEVEIVEAMTAAALDE